MRHPRPRATSPYLLGALIILAAGCEDPVGNRLGAPSALRLVSGNGQQDTVGATLAESLVVRVVDGAGHSLPGITVTWGNSPTAGDVDPFTTVTDANGFARAAWHLGFVPGPQTATATVAGVPPLVFTATVLAIIRQQAVNWSLVHRGLPEPDAPIVGIAGSNASDVFTVAADGRTYWFDGAGWIELLSGTVPGALTSMWGPASNPILATGVTTDGTAAFVARFALQQWMILHSVPGGSLHAMHGRSANDVWAVGSEVAHYDGSAWKRIASPGGTLRAVWAIADGVAIVGADDGEVYKVDSTATRLGNSPGAGIRAIFAFAHNDIYAGDSGGSILHWNGAQWTVIEQLEPEPIVAMWGSGPTDLWAVGGSYAHFDGVAWTTIPEDEAQARGIVAMWGSASDAIWAVTDSMRLRFYDGQRWREHWDSPTAFTGIWGRSATDLFVCGGQGTIQQYDGNGWSAVSLAGWQPCRDIDGSAGSIAVATTGSAYAYRWDGSDWQRSATGGVTTEGVWVHPSGIAIAPGPAGTVLRYDGMAWTTISTGSAAQLRAVWGASATDVWAAGDGGTILHFDGSTWAPVPSGSTGTIRRLWGSGTANVLAVVGDAASGGSVLHYDGTRWSTAHSTTTPLLAISGRTASDVFAVGTNGVVVRFDGSAWHTETSGITETLFDVWASPEGDVIAVGARGLILRGRR